MAASPFVRRVLLVIAGLGALALLVRALPDSAPDSDFALIDLQVQNVLHGAQPLGAYSRFGWSHPGPAYFQLLAPLYWLSGLRHLSVLVGAMLINVGSLAGILFLLRKYSTSQALGGVALAVLGAFIARSWGLLASPWNAHVPILPLALLVTVAAATAAGAIRLLPAVVALASLVVQTHVGFALSAGVVTVATMAFVIAHRDRWNTRSLARACIGAAVAGAVLWAVPLVSEFTSGRHNLRDLFTFFGGVHPMDGRVANRLFAHYFVAPLASDLQLPWGNILTARVNPMATVAIAQTLLLVVAAIGWHRQRRRFEAALALMVIAASAAALVSIHRLEASPNDHAVYWVAILGVLAWSIGLAFPIELVAGRVMRVPRVIFACATVAAVVAGVWQVGALHEQFVRGSRRIEALTDVVRKALDDARATSPLLYVAQSNWAPIAGVVLQLDRAGLAPQVDSDRVRMFGGRLAPTGRESMTIRFADPDEARSDFRFRLDQRPIGVVDGISVYAQEAVPATVAAPPLTLVSPPSALVPTWVATTTPGANVLGIRLSGDPDTIWQIQCRADDSARTPLGLVQIGSGPAPQSGEAYLRDLPSCRDVVVTSVRNDGARLSDLQLLVRR